jgi:hypothetical protein
MVYLAAAALVVAALSASITRGLTSTTTSTIAPVPTPLPSPVEETNVTVTTVESTAPPALLSEADLLAADPSETARVAAAHAEWFATVFFTLDGSEATATEVAGMLPGGSPIPSQEGHRSFVEWARAIEVEQLDAGRFRVRVVVRAVGAADGDAYQRMPSQAIDVVVEMGSEGATVVDLPSPAPLPARTTPAPWPEGGEVPETILAAALTATGGKAEVLTAAAVGDLYRVVVLVEDLSGATWPLAVWLDESGQPVPAGSRTG